MTRKSVCALFLGAAVVAGGCQKKDAAPSPATSPAASMSEDEKAVYALGAAMGQQVARQVKALNLSPAEVETLKKAFEASLAGQKPEHAIEQYGPKLQARAEAQAATAAVAEKAKSAAFRDTAAAEAGAVKTASGLVFKSITSGRGASPKPTDVVQVNYRGTLIDGTEFDASAKHGGPATFRLNGVVPCWTEGVQLMKVGEKAKLVCPSEIAYGDRGTPDGSIPPGATLVFEVELLGINPKGSTQAPGQ
jgi:FKBP-type peptidyl-prolyl cis-trans isomerase FkpA